MIKELGISIGMGVLLCSTLVWPASFNSRGMVSIESRAFPDDDLTQTHDAGLSVSTRFESMLQANSIQGKFRFFGRNSFEDTTRDIVYLEEAWLGWGVGPLQLQGGVQLFNWDALEVFHSADVLNGRNFDSNFENAEKVGEPMVTAKYLWKSGALSGHYMPVAVMGNFPEERNRLQFGDASMFNDPIFMGLDRTDSIFGFTRTHQWAVRMVQSFPHLDVSLHWLNHQDRSQPAFLTTIDSDTGLPGFAFDSTTGKLQPVFLPVEQIGGTAQAVLGPWTLKLEVANRNFDLQTDSSGNFADVTDHTQLAVGGEHIHPLGGGIDGIAMLEYSRFLGTTEAEREIMGFFQNDVFLAYRIDFNDIAAKQLLVAVIMDVERSREYMVQLAYRQRLSDVWMVGTGIRIIDAPQEDTSPFPIGLEQLNTADHVYLTFTRFF